MNGKLLIAFDYDGVIVDSLHRNLSVVVRASQHLGIGVIPTRDDIEILENVSFEDLGRQIKVPEIQIKDFTAIIFNQLAQYADTIPLFEGMSDVLLKLSQKHTLVIITLNTRKVVENFLNTHGLVQCFAEIIGAECEGSKHEKIIRAYQQLNFEKHLVYVVGDTTSDIREAKLAGTKSIAVTWGFQSPKRLIGESPDYLAQTPKDILDIIEAINN